MSKLGSYSGSKVVQAFQNAGWSISRKSGSHIIMEKPDYISTLSVPVHKGKDVKRGTLRDLIKDAGMSVKEFITYLK
jgi:predicted RNA binding protein YcfA (HicA-like mRNA interferase family)